jgi:glycosyltransferase involved in cell wall biosynthesis
VAELIREGGWLVKHKGGVEDLSECLRDAISNPDERRRRGNLAKKLIEPFTPEKHLSSWDSLIENLL